MKGIIMAKTADQKRTARYSRTQVRAKLTEKLGDAVIEYALDDEGTQVFQIEHPFFRSDETNEALKPLDDDDAEGVATISLNALEPGGYERFVQAGGTNAEISHLLLEIQLETNAALAASRPTNR